MFLKLIAKSLVVALVAFQFACVSYVEKTQRVSIDTAESLNYRQDVKDTIVLEIITRSGERITFHNVPPAKIIGDHVEGFTTLAKDLEIKREDIAVIEEESPERMTVRSKDNSVYYFDQYTREGDVINGKGQIRTKLSIRLDDIKTVWFSYKKTDLKRSRAKTWGAVGLGLLAYSIYYLATHDIM
jgi:hypothetical protein